MDVTNLHKHLRGLNALSRNCRGEKAHLSKFQYSMTGGTYIPEMKVLISDQEAWQTRAIRFVQRLPNVTQQQLDLYILTDSSINSFHTYYSRWGMTILISKQRKSSGYCWGRCSSRFFHHQSSLLHSLHHFRKRVRRTMPSLSRHPYAVYSCEWTKQTTYQYMMFDGGTCSVDSCLCRGNNRWHCEARHA